MNGRLPVLLVLLSAALGGAWAADSGTAVLFVTSTPLWAEVALDGKPQGRTPLLLKDLPPGRHGVEIARAGYRSSSLELLLAPAEVRVLEFPLATTGIQASFPVDSRIVLAGRVEESTDRVFVLEKGRFSLQREAGLTYLDPLYPQQRLIDALHLSIPFMLAFTGALTIAAVADPPEPRRPLPPAVLAAHGATLSMIGLDVALNLHKRKQLPAYRYATRPREDLGEDGWRLYREGERLLAAGELDEALAEYERIVQLSPGSDALPWAVYRIADIRYLQGDHDAAAREYERIVREYPLSQLYDRCCKNLADLNFRRERYEDSLRFLDEMVFRDPVFTREEIAYCRCEILESWARKDPAVRPRLIRQLEEFITVHAGSASLELVRRKLAEWPESAL